MQFYRDKIEELYESLYKQYELCRKEYHVYPAGNLISARQGDKLRYFNARTVDGRYLRKDITSHENEIKALARKGFLGRMIKLMRADLRKLQQLTRDFQTFEADEIISSMASVYKKLPSNWLTQYVRYNDHQNMSFDPLLVAERNSQASERMKIHRAWAEAPYDSSRFREEEKSKVTSRGLRMRSKSEVMIAEMLYQYGVPFRYEQVLMLDGKTFAPDFTFQDAVLELFYMEYCGMMGDPEYVKRHMWKRDIYEQNGIVPWKNIYYIYENNGDINMQEIRHFIEDKILPRL